MIAARNRKPYNSDPWDVAICAWCTNQFPRTKQQADKPVRYCCKRCAGYGADVGRPEGHYAMLARRSAVKRAANKLAALESLTAGLTASAAYLKGYRAGYSAGKARRQAATLRAHTARRRATTEAA